MTVFHVALIQSYATALSGVIDMQQIVNDPVRGLRGIAKYKSGLALMDKAMSMLQIK